MVVPYLGQHPGAELDAESREAEEGRQAVARVVLAATGGLPWRTMAFLEDAHARGVLRQTGGVFQFRHASLQEHLINQAPPARDGRARLRLWPQATRLLGRWPALLLRGLLLFLGSAYITQPISRSGVSEPSGRVLSPLTVPMWKAAG